MKRLVLRSLALLLILLLTASGCGKEPVRVNFDQPFDSYGVPVLPLQLYELPDVRYEQGAEIPSLAQVSAKRTVSAEPIDASHWEITDTYVLSNESTSDFTLMSAYPHAMGENWLVDLSVGGTTCEYDVYYGTPAPSQKGSRTGYADLLAADTLSGELLESTIDAVDEAADSRVYVYRINATNMPQNPNDLKNQVGVTLHYDHNATRVYTDGGIVSGDTIIYPYSTVTCGTVIAVGEPITNFKSTGYYDGVANRWDPAVEVSDWFLLLGEEIQNYFVLEDHTIYYSEEALINRARSATAEINRRRACMYAITFHPDKGELLEDLLPGNVAEGTDSLFYVLKELTIPAGKALAVSYHFTVETCIDSSADTGAVVGSGVEIYTQTGSSVNFTSQTASVAGVENRLITSNGVPDGDAYIPSGERCFLYVLNDEVATFPEEN